MYAIQCKKQQQKNKKNNNKKQKENNNKKKKQQQKSNTDPDKTLYSVSSAELAQKVVKVKFGQIHLNEVFVGEFLQSLGYRFTCSYM